MTSGIVAVSFSNGDAEISLLSLGNGHWTGTWQPSDANAAQLVITVLAQSVQPQLSGTEQISGAVKPNPGVPTVNPGGVVGAASLAPLIPVAPGDLVAIFGANLAGALVQSRNLPLATELGNTQATLAGQPMPLMFAAGGQVNAMVPYGLPPNTVQQIVVQYNQAYSLPQPVTIAPALPGVFNKNGVGIIVVVKPDHTQFIADANHPASAGDTLIIYCAGLGPVSPPVAAGSAAPLSPLSKTTNTVLATIGRQNATITFSGLTPTLAGLYQVNAKVPAGITSGPAVPIVLTVAGASSPPVTIAIQ